MASAYFQFCPAGAASSCRAAAVPSAVMPARAQALAPWLAAAPDGTDAANEQTAIVKWVTITPRSGSLSIAQALC